MTDLRKETAMNIERSLRLLAGLFVFASAALGYYHSPYWLLFAAFVGLNLFQSGITNWCPMVWVLQRLGLEPCVAVAKRTE